MNMRKLPPDLPVDQAGTFNVVPHLPPTNWPTQSNSWFLASSARGHTRGLALGARPSSYSDDNHRLGPAEIVAAVNHSLPSVTLTVRSSNYRDARRRF